MLLKTILNRVEKHKSFVYVGFKLKEEEEVPELEIELRPRSNSWAICSGCGEKRSGYDTLTPRRFEFIPLWGILVFFVYAMRRVDCPQCGVKVEKIPWAVGKRRLTRTYAWFLAQWAKRLSWSEVAKVFHTTWYHVFYSVEMAVHWGRKHVNMEGIRAIGIDEIQWKCGHRYLTLVYQIDQGCRRLLWIGQERTVETMRGFFDWFGEARTEALAFICSDMWKPYIKVIKEKAGQAIHILDRFHIVAQMNRAIDQVRAQEAKELKDKGYDPVLKKSRWCLLKRPENLTESQEIKLADLLKYNLKSVRSYLLKEDFQLFWEYQSPAWAGKFLDEWCKRTMRSRIEPMKKTAKMLRKHRELILNWFRAKKEFSSGVVEGLNNKAKLTTRKAYGFSTFQMVEIALYHTLANLPEPETTHKANACVENRTQLRFQTGG